jgi:formylglycine-generating enzyme required for sulfatase activity
MRLVPIQAGKLAVKGRELRVAKPLFFGAYEVTQAQYQEVVGANPSKFSDNPNNPVENVVYDEAVAFCQKLSSQPKEKRAGRSYRLPKADEWEYACRAGAKTKYNFGDVLPYQFAAFNGIEPDGSEKGPQLMRPFPVGSFAPNEWGLYDMHGNVWEWCQDRTKDGARVQCGGSWRNSANDCRASLRAPFAPSTRADTIGLRVVCEINPDAKDAKDSPAD